MLKDWWTSEDAAKFNARAERLGAQYESFEILPGEHINGKLTMGENIGDMGGLTLALDAYQASLHGATAPVLDGVSGVQRVFFGWAQVWRQKMRDEAQRTAHAYGAEYTPEAYVLDAKFKVRYIGRVDDNWQHPDKARSHDLREAITAVLAGQPVVNPLTHAIGCTIKWKY